MDLFHRCIQELNRIFQNYTLKNYKEFIYETELRNFLERYEDNTEAEFIENELMGLDYKECYLERFNDYKDIENSEQRNLLEEMQYDYLNSITKIGEFLFEKQDKLSQSFGNEYINENITPIFDEIFLIENGKQYFNNYIDVNTNYTSLSYLFQKSKELKYIIDKKQIEYFNWLINNYPINEDAKSEYNKNGGFKSLTKSNNKQNCTKFNLIFEIIED
jgi:hypothetical protein